MIVIVFGTKRTTVEYVAPGRHDTQEERANHHGGHDLVLRSALWWGTRTLHNAWHSILKHTLVENATLS